MVVERERYERKLKGGGRGMAGKREEGEIEDGGKGGREKGRVME